MAQENSSSDVKPVEARKASVSELRETYARSDFEKLVFANLPHGDRRNLVQTTRYTVTTKEQTDQINDLKADIWKNVENGSDFEWKEAPKLKSQFQCGSGFDLDMYIRFEETEESEKELTVGDLLGTTGERLEIIDSSKSEEEYRQTPINHETWLWVEICTDPLMARQKLYQLFRAHMVLKPDDDKKIIRKKSLPI